MKLKWTKIIIILFALLLLNCNEAEGEQTEQTLSGADIEMCDSLCDDGKIKVEYEKRFGKPITDYELSIKGTYSWFESWWGGGYVGEHKPVYTTVYRAPTGIFAKYTEVGDETVRLTLGEWLDFINGLYYKSHLYEWEKHRSENKLIMDGGMDYLRVFFSDSKFKVYNTESEGDFGGVLINMERKIELKVRKNALIPLETELAKKYEERFGEPISDFEKSIVRIYFQIGESYEKSYAITRTRTNTNAVLNEWLELIRDLRRVRVDKWQREYKVEDKDGFAVKQWLRKMFPAPDEEWELLIYTWDDKEMKFFGKNKYPANWKEFKKISDDLIAGRR